MKKPITSPLTPEALEKEILESFAGIAETIGYSPLHGKIIGILLFNEKPISLSHLAKETGYSPSMISLSLDFLEVMGVVKKIKKPGDRKLYVQMEGDLLDILRRAIVMKAKRGITNTLKEFEEYKHHADGMRPEEKKRIIRMITILEKEMQRLNYYITLLSEIKLP